MQQNVACSLDETDNQVEPEEQFVLSVVKSRGNPEHKSREGKEAESKDHGIFCSDFVLDHGVEGGEAELGEGKDTQNQS